MPPLSHHHLSSLIVPLILLIQRAFSQTTGDVTIKSSLAFNVFTAQVNDGTSYEGTTVFLGEDLEFSNEESRLFNPIGNQSCSFSGVFDGQGYVIRNLAVTSSLQHVGVFGFLKGATIRNLVIDEACSVKSDFNSDTCPFSSAVLLESVIPTTIPASLRIS